MRAVALSNVDVDLSPARKTSMPSEVSVKGGIGVSRQKPGFATLPYRNSR
jgi:hypothetical protein